MKIIKLLLFLIPLVLLGCGESTDNGTQNSEKIYVEAPIATDSFSQLSLQRNEHEVSLSNSIYDPQGLPVTLESVTALRVDATTLLLVKMICLLL